MTYCKEWYMKYKHGVYPPSPPPHTHTHTHTHIHRTTTVTLVAHACRGLITTHEALGALLTTITVTTNLQSTVKIAVAH